jgi:hypothetical protein
MGAAEGVTAAGGKPAALRQAAAALRAGRQARRGDGDRRWSDEVQKAIVTSDEGRSGKALFPCLCRAGKVFALFVRSPTKVRPMSKPVSVTAALAHQLTSCIRTDCWGLSKGRALVQPARRRAGLPGSSRSCTRACTRSCLCMHPCLHQLPFRSKPVIHRCSRPTRSSCGTSSRPFACCRAAAVVAGLRSAEGMLRSARATVTWMDRTRLPRGPDRGSRGAVLLGRF